MVTPSTPMHPLKFPPPPREFIQQRQEGFVFKHLFTATISGPTSCGKTHFCKVLLQHFLTMIWPPPERILLLCKRWQPLYDVMILSLLEVLPELINYSDTLKIRVNITSASTKCENGYKDRNHTVCNDP